MSPKGGGSLDHCHARRAVSLGRLMFRVVEVVPSKRKLPRAVVGTGAACTPSRSAGGPHLPGIGRVWQWGSPPAERARRQPDPRALRALHLGGVDDGAVRGDAVRHLVFVLWVHRQHESANALSVCTELGEPLRSVGQVALERVHQLVFDASVQAAAWVVQKLEHPV